MSDNQILEDGEIADPIFDRRSGYDRRLAYDLNYFTQGGIERRTNVDRRKKDDLGDRNLTNPQYK